MLKNYLFILLAFLVLGCNSINAKQALIEEKSGIPNHKYWLTDMNKAQAIAKAEGKDILMFFTGSDWCGYCILLVDEVFNQAEFIDYAKNNFVLVDLDFPDGESVITPKQRQHNEKWGEKFSVENFPSVILTDASANAYAISGYHEGGSKNYIKLLTQLKSNKAEIPSILKKIEKASGIDRAKLIDKLVSFSEKGNLIKDKKVYINEVMALVKGKDNKLYNKYSLLKASQDIGDELDKLNWSEQGMTLESVLKIYKKYPSVKDGEILYNLIAAINNGYLAEEKKKEGLAFMDSILVDKSYSTMIRQNALLFKGGMLIDLDASAKSIDAAKILFKQVIKMDENSLEAEKARDLIDELGSM
jgi:protein disulfide-isomerase